MKWRQLVKINANYMVNIWWIGNCNRNIIPNSIKKLVTGKKNSSTSALTKFDVVAVLVIDQMNYFTNYATQHKFTATSVMELFCMMVTNVGR